MDFLQYKTAFDDFTGVKAEPNTHEIQLFERAQKYIAKIARVPGIRMVAVVNSLSMYATHTGSDIDLFIVTEKNRMWIARVLITSIFFFSGVWRHGKDVAGNFCLSFWIEEDAIDMKDIAIEDDIYLFFWMYYMKPIFLRGDIWEVFQTTNSEYSFSSESTKYFLGTKSVNEQSVIFSRVLDGLNMLLRIVGEKKALWNWESKGKPSGVIIRPNILKFHDNDKRQEIRKELLDR